MNKTIEYLGLKNIYDNKIIFVRSIFAISALLLLLCNDFSYLVSDLGLRHENFFQQYSLFAIFGIQTGKIISIFILVFVLTGYLPQLSCILQAWVHLSICASLVLIEGGDQLASNLSIFLIPVCLFDNRFNQWGKKKEDNVFRYYRVFVNIYYFIIPLQISIVYLHAAIGKLNRPDWRDGTCLYYWLTDNTIGAPKIIQHIITPFLLSSYLPLLTWSIIIIELILFASILSSNIKQKKVFLLIGIVMHAGFALFHGLINFSLIMIGALILYLDNENIILNSIKAIIQNISSWFLKRSSQH